MLCYLDSSVLLRFLLGVDERYLITAEYGQVGSSELLYIECSRVIERYRMQNLITDEQVAETRERLDGIIRGLYIIELTDVIKLRASGSFPTVVGTLGALHLSSALLWKEYAGGEELGVLSDDIQLSTCAKALGFCLL